MGITTVEGTKAKLDEEIARLEELQYPNSGQGEQALDGEETVAPVESLELNAESTEEVFKDGTTQEDATIPNTVDTDELGRLRKELADEKYRFSRYKGSTDKTIFKLRKDNSTLNSTVASLKQSLAELNSSVSPEADIDSAFSQDVIDILGEEAVEAIKTTVKAAQDKANNLEKRLTDKEVASHTESAEDLKQKNEADFMAELTRYVPDVLEMDVDPKFNDWLAQAGPDGTPRLTRLREYQDYFDAYRVAQFFLEYKALKVKPKARDSVSNHIGPAGTQTSSSEKLVDEAKKGYIKQSEIDSFNEAVARGEYKYDSVAAEAMEAKIFKAMHEDKIIYNA